MVLRYAGVFATEDIALLKFDGGFFIMRLISAARRYFQACVNFGS
jgi:hypothetical protein